MHTPPHSTQPNHPPPIHHPAEDSFLASFFQQAEGKAPDEIAALLAADDRVDAAHGCAAAEGQSEQTGEDVVSVRSPCLAGCPGDLAWIR